MLPPAKYDLAAAADLVMHVVKRALPENSSFPMSACHDLFFALFDNEAQLPQHFDFSKDALALAVKRAWDSNGGLVTDDLTLHDVKGKPTKCAWLQHATHEASLAGPVCDSFYYFLDDELLTEAQLSPIVIDALQ